MIEFTEKLHVVELKRKPRKGSKARARLIEPIAMLEDQHRAWQQQLGLHQKTSKRDFNKWVDSVFKHARKIFIVQRKNGCIEGTCFVRWNEYGNSFWITNLIISPKFRNQGYGTKLLNAAFAACKGKVPSISVCCLNVPAMKLYAKLGFKPLHMSMVKLKKRRTSIKSLCDFC